MIKVVIVILNHNGVDLTLDCLSSLRLIIKKELEVQVVVIDNNSRDDSVNQIKKNYPEVEIISAPENLGFTGGNNLGVKIALEKFRPNYLLLLNNDTIVDKNFLMKLVDFAESKNNGALFFPKIYFAHGHEFHKNRYKKSDLGNVIWFAGGIMDWDNVYSSHIGVDQVDSGQFNSPKEIEVGTGCCVLVNPNYIDKNILFDDKFFLYYEDTDLCLRMNKNKFTCWFVPESKIWHVNSGASGSGSELHDYYLTRNRMLIAMRYASTRTKLAVFRESIKLLFYGRKWQKIGIRDYYLNKFGKGSYNI